MKTFIEQLQNKTEDLLQVMIAKQKHDIWIMKRDLDTMERVLMEKLNDPKS